MAKVGRPQIQLSDLPDGWQDGLIELAKEGASIVELSGYLEIGRDTFYALSDREPLFSDTIKRCKALSEQWWEKQGRTNLTNKDFSYTGWYMNMKNRFGWRDRTDVTSDDKPLKNIALVEFVDEPNKENQDTDT